MYKQSLLLLFLVYWLAACTADLEPIVVTRVVEATAVPPPLTPTPTPLPALTATPAPPTATATAVATIETATALPPTAVATATPAISLSEFLSTLQNTLNTRDFETLKGLVTARFTQNVYPLRKDIFQRAHIEALGLITGGWDGEHSPEIMIDKENILAELTEPFMPETVLGTNQTITAVVHSSGWGTAGTMQGLLYITVENGAYAWAGILASGDNFTLVPTLPLLSPPPGLIYRLENEWWYVNQSGIAESLPINTLSLSINPGGTAALYADDGDHQVRLFPWPLGEEEALPVDGTLLHGSWHMPWLDDETVLLMLGPYDEGVYQGSMGNLALFNVLEGTLATLPIQQSVYHYPSVTADGRILYNKDNNTYIWRDGLEQKLDFAQTLLIDGVLKEISGLREPVMSPDGQYVVGVSGVEYGRYGSAYVLADLTNQTTTLLFPFIHLPTDAALSVGVHWSPDSQWVALDPPVWIWDNNVPLISVANPENPHQLGTGTSLPLWLDDNQLIFKSVNYQQTRWRYLDLDTGEQFWLDLPDGVEVVQYVPQN
ncbi:MAG: hypothetical protein H6658_16525 [Ardenticatenaceae bacterium]|nr:hypothetical protein [Ardenticatenaceae bacterium]